MSFLASVKRNKGFSSSNKVQHYHGDGTESIIVMGRPFRVIRKLGDVPSAYLGLTTKPRHLESKSSYIYLVENVTHLSEFPRHLALKRAFFGVDQVSEAHKEIEIMNRIKDKNIVRIFHSEVSRNEGKLGVSIAMEYCGNNLERRIRSGGSSGAGVRMTESEICHVLLALTSAVGYLHVQQPPIAHRDIRPENVLINNNQTGPMAYKLCNFGSATTEAYQCETREEAGAAIEDIERHTSPAFRAPEMADPWSKQRISEKADLWAIGVLVYYMMYMQLPFKPNNMALTGNPRVKFPSSATGRYTPSLCNLVEHLLEPDPEKRWDVFALTNFLRFDEDISRHLGLFVFTETEWPEGWEEQDVKVIGREKPAKQHAPVAYGKSIGERVTGRAPTHSQSGELHNDASHTHNSNADNNKNDDNDEESVREALRILNMGNSATNSVTMQQLLREQEEALEMARQNRSSAATTTTTTAAAVTQESRQAGEQGARNGATGMSAIDDLFAPIPVAPTASAAAGAAPGSRAITDDLFADVMAAPVQATAVGGAAMPQLPQQADVVYSAGMISSSPWGTAASFSSGAPPAALQQQQPPYAMMIASSSGSGVMTSAPGYSASMDNGVFMPSQGTMMGEVGGGAGLSDIHTNNCYNTTRQAKKDSFTDLFS